MVLRRRRCRRREAAGQSVLLICSLADVAAVAKRGAYDMADFSGRSLLAAPAGR